MVKVFKSGFDGEEVLRQFQQRGYSPAEVSEQVAKIIAAVAERGDEAVCEFTRAFDHVELRPDQLAVDPKDIEIAERLVDPDLLASVELAAERVRRFHEAEKRKSWWLKEPGGSLGQQIRPIQTVGVYAPGGKAVLLSTALMNIIPAQVAGCERIVVSSPPQADLQGRLSPAILAVLHTLGEHEAYRMGGAQAIAALALGTQHVPKVDMICGPGNVYVTEAKRQLQGKVRIEGLAGPSEVLIIADETARADFIAADLLAQLEHDETAAAMLLTTDGKLLAEVSSELERQKASLLRNAILDQSLKNNCYLVRVETLEEAFELANAVAPEHLELMLPDARSHVAEVHHAGAIFLGAYSPEAIGDYVAGPNHVLPTGGTARFASGLSVDDFIKKSSLTCFDRNGFEALAEAAILLAQAEGLDAHANSIRIRL